MSGALVWCELQTFHAILNKLLAVELARSIYNDQRKSETNSPKKNPKQTVKARRTVQLCQQQECRNKTRLYTMHKLNQRTTEFNEMAKCNHKAIQHSTIRLRFSLFLLAFFICRSELNPVFVISTPSPEFCFVSNGGKRKNMSRIFSFCNYERKPKYVSFIRENRLISIIVIRKYGKRIVFQTIKEEKKKRMENNAKFIYQQRSHSVPHFLLQFLLAPQGLGLRILSDSFAFHQNNKRE